MDMYRDWSDEALDEHRRAILTEQERRAKVAALPEQVAAMTRDAIDAGVNPESLRAAIDDALPPQEGPGTTEHPSGWDITN